MASAAKLDSDVHVPIELPAVMMMMMMIDD
jgi:hypothetical protein